MELLALDYVNLLTTSQLRCDGRFGGLAMPGSSLPEKVFKQSYA
jgi:hypothetical protein